MACRYTNMLMTARHTAPVSLMLLRRCWIQCYNVSTASLTGCAQTASNSMQTRQSWCGARHFVNCCNYPAAGSPLLVYSVVLSMLFVTWVHLSTTILVRTLMFGKLCHAASLHFTSFVNTSPTTASIPWWCRLCTQDLTCPGQTSSIPTAAPPVHS